MDIVQLRQSLKTVITVPITPFDASGELDLPACRRLIGRLIEGGLRVIALNGNTSEFYSLTVEECRVLVETAVEAAAGRAAIIAGIGYSARTAAAMAQAARQAGADGVMVHQLVHPFRSAEGWVAYHRAIAEAVPELGLVPYIRDSQVSAPMLNALLEACPNLAGIKYAVPDPQLFASLVTQVGGQRIAWVCGLAEGWAPFFWAGGAVGFTSGLVNVDSRLPLAMLGALQAGDYPAALAIWAQVKPFEELRARRQSANNVSVIKEALRQLGLCTPVVRPPISELPEAERAEVSAIMAALAIGQPDRRPE
ncbi:MAG: dihydrodipicolinate synthase family protein [Anaerolineales bacterium]